MAIMVWNDTFVLGVKEFDEHHRHLVGIINRLYDEYSNDPAAGDAAGVINELGDYAAYHFAAEEQWLKENSYPGLPQQIEEHAKFSARVAALKEEALAGQVTTSELFYFLSDWLTTHILESDADYGLFHAAQAKNEQKGR
jgi:hemerythrin